MKIKYQGHESVGQKSQRICGKANAGNFCIFAILHAAGFPFEK